MPRIKKRKQGLVAKLNSKSFVYNKVVAIVVLLRLNLSHGSDEPDLPDYVKDNLRPSTVNGIEMLQHHRNAWSNAEGGARVDMNIPLGLADLSKVSDSKWIIRRLLIALHLDHLGLEKQMYDRLFLLTQNKNFSSSASMVTSLAGFEQECGRSIPLATMLGGTHKIVGGVRKPLPAYLREALQANEGSAAARQIWALLLINMMPSLYPKTAHRVVVHRVRRIKIRTTANKIADSERILERLANRNVSDWQQIAKKDIVLSSPAEASLTIPVCDDTAADMRRSQARLTEVDPRRTRLAYLRVDTVALDAWSNSDTQVAEICPHKAVIDLVEVLKSREYRQSYFCADAVKLLRNLLKISPKELTMGMVQRATKNIWPNLCTMGVRSRSWDSPHQLWFFVAVQHAAHTT